MIQLHYSDFNTKVEYKPTRYPEQTRHPELDSGSVLSTESWNTSIHYQRSVKTDLPGSVTYLSIGTVCPSYKQEGNSRTAHQPRYSEQFRHPARDAGSLIREKELCSEDRGSGLSAKTRFVGFV